MNVSVGEVTASAMISVTVNRFLAEDYFKSVGYVM